MQINYSQEDDDKDLQKGVQIKYGNVIIDIYGPEGRPREIGIVAPKGINIKTSSDFIRNLSSVPPCMWDFFSKKEFKVEELSNAKLVTVYEEGLTYGFMFPSVNYKLPASNNAWGETGWVTFLLPKFGKDPARASIFNEMLETAEYLGLNLQPRKAEDSKYFEAVSRFVPQNFRGEYFQKFIDGLARFAREVETGIEPTDQVFATYNDAISYFKEKGFALNVDGNGESFREFFDAKRGQMHCRLLFKTGSAGEGQPLLCRIEFSIHGMDSPFSREKIAMLNQVAGEEGHQFMLGLSEGASATYYYVLKVAETGISRRTLSCLINGMVGSEETVISREKPHSAGYKNIAKT